MKTLTGVLALMLALMFGASSVVIAAEKEKMAFPGAASAAKPAAGTTAGNSAQNICSQVKRKVLEMSRGVRTCVEKANKEARANDAKNCWDAFPKDASVKVDRSKGERIPDSECPAIGSSGSPAAKVSCFHSYATGDSICCAGKTCCAANGSLYCWNR